MLEQVILGTIQGITEWLPISSEGFLVLVQTNFFSGDLMGSLGTALFLHLGTVLATLVYFRKDIIDLSKKLFKLSSATLSDKNVIRFLIVTTIISGLIGLVILLLLPSFESSIGASAKGVTLFIGVLLLITGFIQLAHKGKHLYKTEKDVTLKDDVLLGLVQGLAALPGLSRSGLTVSTLLLRRYDKEASLKLSFLMSIPIVILGNIALNLNGVAFNSEALVGLVFSFIFGLATINVLFKVAKKINFGYFVLIFGALAILAVLI